VKLMLIPNIGLLSVGTKLRHPSLGLVLLLSLRVASWVLAVITQLIVFAFTFSVDLKFGLHVSWLTNWPNV